MHIHLHAICMQIGTLLCMHSTMHATDATDDDGWNAHGNGGSGTDDDGWNSHGNGGSGSDDEGCGSGTGKCGSGDSCGGGDGCGCLVDSCGNSDHCCSGPSGDSCGNGDSCAGGAGCGCAGDSCGGGCGCAGDSCGVGDNCESGTGVVSSVVSSIHTTVCTWMDIKYKNEITMNILCHTKCIRYYIILV